ncbi:hypothetical protein ACFO25_09905 [Paenactinomyces guangxiensis]|uniref:Uncharacterized protein n=1 Tax=Paenactinomyces guangxiensis TaxID=1490290 RepID=A0A7W1WS74_9BACL|nr:hypothetical protein [Paenactinomyces guangxiensis]MBA4495098.1 hypothetical protein [Paenactinomyces guangxiensis]MBH8592218.1 hypothetical protein [Paenactinomyces guangxiensis]
MAKQGFLGAIKVKSGPSVAFTDVPLTDSGDQTTYIVSDETKRYWDRSAAVTVEKSSDGTNWTTVPASDYKIEYVGGRIVFNAPQVSTDSFRVDAAAYPIETIVAGFEWSLDLEQEVQDTPTFGDGWNDVTPTRKSGSGSFSWYWANGTFFEKLGDDDLIIILYVDETNNIRYEFTGAITTDSIETPNDGVVTEELEFMANGEIYYRES